jgi:predicted protein tyrosine phosphatase
MSTNFLMNRLANSTNPYQGEYKKVLCVCSAGILRSPTAAMVLSQEPYNFNTRAAGLTAEFALVPVDEVLLQWADLIVCMDDRQEAQLREMLGEEERPIVNLGIPDVYGYRDPVLIDLIRERYDFLTKEKKDDSEI